MSSVPPVAVFPLLLTKKQASVRLSVCVRTLERLIAAGDFPQPLKIRGRSCVPQTDVETYVSKLHFDRSLNS